MRKLLSLISILCVLIICAMPMWSQAFADCENIETNPEWLDNMSKLEKCVNNGDYDCATETARALFRICNKSPRLHALTGLTMKNNGEVDRAEKYFQRAVELSAEYGVSLEDARLAWDSYYEFRNPESAKDVIDARKRALDSMQNAVMEVQEKNELLTNQLINTGGMEIINNYKGLMWSGVGIGSAGIASIVVGGVLVGKSEKVKKSNLGEEISIKRDYVTGWTLLGLGIGMTAVGVALAGYGGYKYADVSKKKDKSNNYQWDIGPGSAMFTYQF